MNHLWLNVQNNVSYYKVLKSVKAHLEKLGGGHLIPPISKRNAFIFFVRLTTDFVERTHLADS